MSGGFSDVDDALGEEVVCRDGEETRYLNCDVVDELRIVYHAGGWVVDQGSRPDQDGDDFVRFDDRRRPPPLLLSTSLPLQRPWA